MTRPRYSFVSGSPPLTINWDEWKSIGKGALIAAAGGAVTALVNWAGTLDMSTVQAVVAAAVVSVLVNIARKYIPDTRQ